MAPFNHDTDYVVVARTDGSSRDITLYNYADGTQHSTASATDGNTLSSVTNADTKICMGWSTRLTGNEGFYGSIKGLAVWDTRLTDAEVAALLPDFRSKWPSPPSPCGRVLISRQTAGGDGWLRSDAEWSVNPHNSSAAQFSILDQLEGMGRSSDGKFLFELYWPELEGSPKGPRQMWKQTSNPVTAAGGAAVSGYEAVDAPYTAECWVGLERHGDGHTLLDGSTCSWWYSVGTRSDYSGMPGPSPIVVAQTELYVHTLCPVPKFFGPPKSTCKQHMEEGATTSGAYNLAPVGGGSVYSAYCDMTTDGGGWTLVVKVKSRSTTMNWQNTAQWRDATLLGDTGSLADEDALGTGYANVGFTDVMLQSITDSSKSVGWRHPTAHDNVQAIVQACTKVTVELTETTRLFGTIGELDMTDHSTNQYRMNECSTMYAGFFTHDSTGGRTMAGCSSMASGYAGAVIGIGRETGEDYCVSSFGVGSQYGGGTSGNTGWAINYHWWGAGNSQITNNGYFHSLGVFVR